ncbi:MAG: ABC transporter permease [Romboutsia sp.]|uniref:ABC transporter permease n=1 Tax=Romboutsia sp. TaxID=1965302 RepID=UPI003F334425
MINTTKIAKSNLKQNKSKSVLIIVTIFLATTLLAAVGMTCLDWSEANKENVRKYSGTQHGLYSVVDENTYEIIRNHADIKETGIVNGIGVIEFKDETKIGLGFATSKGIEFNNIEIIEGNIPKSINEIMIDDLALEKLGYKKELNQKINISYGDYTKDGMTEKEFIVSGITKASEQAKARKAYSIVVSEDYMRSTRDMSKENFNVFFTLKDEEKLSGEELKFKIEDIGEKIGLSKAKIKVNEDYIATLKPDIEVMMWGGIIALIVILSSILVIYNIFYLSIITKVQEFGKLRAIGATKKQIKSIVLKEGMILSMIAIPMGIVLGYLINEFILGKIFFNFVNISKLPIAIGVMIVSLLTVFISLIKPMSVASKVSVIEAIRYNGEQNTKSRNRKGYDSINIKKLAYANLTSNKKRTYVTILSLTLSGIIFIVMASVLSSIDAEKMARNHNPYDISISLANYTFGDEESPNTELNMLQMKNPLNDEFVKELEDIEGIKNIEKKNYLKVGIESLNTEYKYDSILGVTERDLEDLEFYLVDGKIDLEKLKSGNEILITYSDLAKDKNIKAGDIISLTLYDGEKEIEKEFKVQAVTDGWGMFAIHEDAFKKLVKVNTTNSLGIYTDKNKYDEVKSYIKNIVDSSEYFRDSYIDGEIEAYKLSVYLTKGIGYSLVIILGVIGFINLINAMITSIITRKKELGMLQAIGLTNKQLVKMLNIEAMFYTGTMLITSLTLGTGLGYIAVQVFRKSGGSYAVYTFPIVQVIIMIACIVIAQLTLTYLISKNFNKESLIDRVRYSE